MLTMPAGRNVSALRAVRSSVQTCGATNLPSVGFREVRGTAIAKTAMLATDWNANEVAQTLSRHGCFEDDGCENDVHFLMNAMSK